MGCPEIKRHTEVIEGIGHTVGKAAYDEEGNAEEQRQILTLSGESDSCGHDESAAYGEGPATQWTCAQACFEDTLSGLLQGHRRAAGNKSYGQTSEDIPKEYKKKTTDLTLRMKPAVPV